MIRTSVVVLIAAGLFVCGAAAAQPGPGGMRPGPTKTILCPPTVQVKFVPLSPGILGAQGWQANEGAFPVQLDPANPPTLSGGNMVCWYKLLNQQGAFDIIQPLNGRKCSPLSNHTGFNCTP